MDVLLEDVTKEDRSLFSTLLLLPEVLLSLSCGTDTTEDDED
jgi:hypothetical protein